MVTLANRGGSDAVQFAVPSPPADSQTLAVLDSGVGENGPWRIEATTADGVCITYNDARCNGGSCQLADPVRLDESSLLSVVDDGEALTVVAGPVPTGATRVTVTTTDGPTTYASIVQLGARTFFHARTPPDTGVRLISAETDDGRTVANVIDLPPPPLSSNLPGGAQSPTATATAQARPGSGASAEDLELVANLRAFAAQPGPDTAQSMYAAGTGPFSALDFLQDERPYEVGVGPHPHCASPPRPAPWDSPTPVASG